MIDMTNRSDDDQNVWRYMSFSRFAWMLMKKELWLSRVELLEDRWEGHLTTEQLNFVVSRHPGTFLDVPQDEPSETALERAERITRWHRARTFVNCWSASDHESHALWRIYCPSSEGVAIQTTLRRLRASVQGLPVRFVDYAPRGDRTPNVDDMVIQKRPMFAYESEVRVVLVSDLTDKPNPEREVVGTGLPWDLEGVVESVRVHPDSDYSFIETVTDIVRQYAPKLADHVAYSAMATRPPF